MLTASTPIGSLELATSFDVVIRSESDAARFLGMADLGDWTDARVRRRGFQLLRACGCSKRLDIHAGVHTFTFVDGSTLNVSRHGVSL